MSAPRDWTMDLEASVSGLIRNFDVDALARQYRGARPTHYFSVDEFLEPAFAREVAAAYPSFENALRWGGKEFARLNEDIKVQVTDAARFPEPVRRLHEVLSSDAFLRAMTEITGIEDLMADPDMQGAGMHLMGPSGYLGVHADFNYLREKKLFRRLNILVYLTPDWPQGWGGEFELWDPAVRRCLQVIPPAFNRCMVFNTTEESFHGVRAIRCPNGLTRNSFAGFYYTVSPPANWNGRHHGTIYRARPEEWRKRYVQMPIESVFEHAREARRAVRRLRRRIGV